MLKLTDEDPINGPAKAWIYNHVVIPKITWELTIYSFPISFLESLEAKCTKMLKRWLQLNKSLTTTALYRSKTNAGLQLTRLTTYAKCSQVIKYHLNKYAKDEKCRDLYKHNAERKKELNNWNGIKELEQRERHLVLNEISNVGRGQTNRAGLGLHPKMKRIAKMNPKEHRQALTSLTKEVDEEQALLYLYNCAKQGQWLKWDYIMSLDSTWKQKLYAWNPNLLSFRINGIHDTLPTPANLHLWNKVKSPLCNICLKAKGTLHHILNNCEVALKQGRYTWRHDQVLVIFRNTILKAIKDKIPLEPSKWIPFETSDKKKYQTGLPPSKFHKTNGILTTADDWEVTMDSDTEPTIFPSMIYDYET